MTGCVTAFAPYRGDSLHDAGISFAQRQGAVSVDEVTGALPDHRANLWQILQRFDGDPVQTVTLTVASTTTPLWQR